MKETKAAKFALITDSTLLIGVDIAKEKHVARACDFRGQFIGKPLPFTNDSTGFNKFLKWANNLMQTSRMTDVIVGMEPTGTYWLSLAHWLKHESVCVVQVNPLHVCRSKELDDNSPTKTDAKDAGVIARLMKDARFTPVNLPEGVYAEMRNLVILRGQTREEITRNLCRLRSWINRFFPEFEGVFRDLNGMAAQAALRQFPLPDDVMKCSVEAIGEVFRNHTKGRVWLKHAHLLRAAAEDSMGVTEGLVAARLHVRALMEQLDLLQRQLAELDDQLSALFRQLPDASIILTIPGLTEVSAATIMAELGDLTRYQHPKQLQKMAGLALREYSSGSHQGAKRINKRGRRKLRSILYLIVLGLVSRDPVFKQLHCRFTTRPERPLAPKQSITALCTKFLTVLLAVVKHKQPYDPNRLLPSCAPAAA